MSNNNISLLNIKCSSDASGLKWDFDVNFEGKYSTEITRHRHHWEDETKRRCDDDSDDDDEEGESEAEHNERTRKWCVKHVIRPVDDHKLILDYECVLESGSDERTTGRIFLAGLVLYVHARDTPDPFR